MSIPDSLSESSQLKSLILSDIPDSSCDGLSQLLTKLAHNTSISEINLSNNLLSASVYDLLEKNKNITELCISNAKISNNILLNLLKAIQSSNSIVSLNLSNILIEQDGIDCLTSLLVNNSSLKRLDISNTCINKNINDLVDAIANSTLTTLYMNRIEFLDKESRQYFIKKIFMSPTLQLISLNNTLFEYDDIIILSDILKENYTLKTLLLKDERISSESIQPLIPTYQKSVSLTMIEAESIDIVGLHIKNLSNRGLNEFPSSLFNMKHLHHLNISNNNISKIPDLICNLENLTFFDVSNNRLTSLPISLTNLKNLKNIKLDNNPFRTPPPEIIKSGNVRTIFNFLNDLKKGEEVVYRTKLMVVGQENVGKTTLLRAFKSLRMKKIFSKKILSKQIMSTDGIDVDEWKIDINFGSHNLSEQTNKGKQEESSSKKTVSIRTWDFAGQDLYYTTHQFFLSKRSIYILVWDLRTDDHKISYWLQSIRSKTKDSPVIIVGTHADCVESISLAQEKAEKIRTKFQKRFPFIRLSISLSCKYELEVAQLLDNIKDIIREQPHMGEIIPKSYYEMDRIIESERIRLKLMNEPPIKSWRDIKILAEDCNIHSDDELKRCLHFLHDLGSLIYFDDKDMRLSDTVVIDPQYLINVMSTIITTKRSIKDGVLHRQELKMIWRPPEYPEDIHILLLSLLGKFEILYTLPESLKAKIGHRRALPPNISVELRNNEMIMDEDVEILIPSLLPEYKPLVDLFWVEKDLLRIQYDRIYKFEFIPLGFFSRLIIRCLHLVDSVCAYWRNGIIGQRRNDIFCLELLNEESIISLSVRGQHSNPPTELLRILVEMIDSFIGKDKWFNIPVQKFVPCTHCMENNLKDFQVKLFRIKQLKENIKKGDYMIECSSTGLPSKVHISRLVPDLSLTDLNELKINYSDIRLIELENENTFHTIHKGIYLDKEVMVKTMKPTGKAIKMKEYTYEVWTMSSMKHPNIIDLLGYTVDPFSIITEWLPLGNLYNFIRNKKRLKWDLILKIALDIAKGMHYLHNSTPSFIHRGLKSTNIYLVDENPNALVCAKIGEFEYSSTVYGLHKSTEDLKDKIWLAPEILRGEEYDEKSDVYSYGLILWELYTNSDPYSEYNTTFSFELEDLIKRGARPTIPEDVPDDFYCLIEACWCESPQRRLTFLEVMKWIVTISADLAPNLILPENTLNNNLENSKQREFSGRDRSTSNEDMNNLSGKLLKTIKLNFPVRIYSLGKVDNNIWVGCNDGSIFLYNSKNGECISRITGDCKKHVLSIIKVNGFVWTLFLGEICRIFKLADIYDAVENIEKNDSIRKEGFLNQKINKFPKRLKKRKLVIKNKKLIMYDSVGERQLLISSLEGAQVFPDYNTRKFGFQIHLMNYKPMSFSCKDKKEQDSWINAIRDEIKEMDSKNIVTHVQDLLMSDIRCLELVDDEIWAGTTSTSIKIWDPNTRLIKNNVSFNIPTLTKNERDLLFVSTIHYFDNRVWVGIQKFILCVDKNTLLPIRVMDSHQQTVTSIVGHGDHIWSCSEDGTVKVWSKHTFQCIMTYSQLGGKLFSITKVGNQIWCSGWDGKIRIFNAKTLKLESCSEETQSDAIYSLCLSGNTIWAGSWDGTINVWT